MKHYIQVSCALILAASGLQQVRAQEGPLWWRHHAIIDEDRPEHNYSPANLGQLKHVATEAADYLDQKLPGGAGVQIHELVGQFEPRPSVNYPPEALVVLREPNYKPINLGQLKAVAKPFYDRLIQAGIDTKAQLIAKGYPSDWAYIYPWDPSTPVGENYSPANLGQLKMVFSFDFAGMDNDGSNNRGDGMLDAWELANGLSPTNAKDYKKDYDGDGLTNLEEHRLGSDPHSLDSDYDGILDVEEAAVGSDLADSTDSAKVRLGYWSFDDGIGRGMRGHDPKVSVNNQFVDTPWGKGLHITGSDGSSQFTINEIEEGLHSNFNLREGTVRLWFKPDWSTGSGLGGWPRLLVVGGWTPDASRDFWAVHIHPPVGSLHFSARTGPSTGDGYTLATLNWVAGDWYNVTVSYSAATVKVYINGVLTGIHPGGPHYARSLERANGMSIGTDHGGGQRVQGTLDKVETYNYVLSDQEVLDLYSQEAAALLDLDGDGMPNSWEEQYGLDPLDPSDAALDLDGEGLSNLREFSLNTSPILVDTDYDGINDAQEILDNTSPIDLSDHTQELLGYWSFDDQAGLGMHGHSPMVSTNNQFVDTPWGKGLYVAPSSNSVFQIEEIEDNALSNINVERGSVSFWFRPDWTSTNNGGLGPEAWAKFIITGTTPVDFWMIHLLDTGDNIRAASNDGVENGAWGGHFGDISWESSKWYHVTVTYDETSMNLYVNGSLVNSKPALGKYPSSLVRSQGFAIGSEYDGTDRVNGVMDEFETYNYPLNPSEIARLYTLSSQALLDLDSDGLTDSWEQGFGGDISDPYQDFNGDGLSVLAELLLDKDPHGPGVQNTSMYIYQPAEQ